MAQAHSEKTNADILAQLVEDEALIDAQEERLEHLETVECLSQELVIALREQGLLNPIMLGLSGCAAAVALERLFDCQAAGNDDEPSRGIRLIED